MVFSRVGEDSNWNYEGNFWKNRNGYMKMDERIRELWSLKSVSYQISPHLVAERRVTLPYGITDVERWSTCTNTGRGHVWQAATETLRTLNFYTASSTCLTAISQTCLHTESKSIQATRRRAET